MEDLPITTSAGWYPSLVDMRIHRITSFNFLLGDGQRRLKSVYDLKHRRYIGNTTMDPELSFIQGNLTGCDSGAMALDPFCGTGGLLLAAAHQGCWVFGTEINYQVARAIGRSARAGETLLSKEQSIFANFTQYALESQLASIILADSSQHHLWHRRSEGLFDCIITDPPYGVRERGRQIRRKGLQMECSVADECNPSSSAPRGVRFPEKSNYHISDVYLDLVNLAAKLLVVGGKLSFWFPFIRKDYSSDMLPKHSHMKLLHNCEQRLAGQASRRLLVYIKTKPVEGEEGGLPKSFYLVDGYKENTFREKIFCKETKQRNKRN